MRALRTIIFMTALFFFGMVSVPALAGAPLNDLSDYAAFGEVRRSDGVVVKYPARMSILLICTTYSLVNYSSNIKKMSGIVSICFILRRTGSCSASRD